MRDIYIVFLVFIWAAGVMATNDVYREINFKNRKGFIKFIVWIIFMVELFYLPRWLMEKGF